MSDILDSLKTWAEHTGGKYETLSTINLTTDKLSLKVCGDSLEDAYNKIKEICGDLKGEFKSEYKVEEEKKESIPSTPNLSNMDLNTASTKTLAEVLGDRKIIRIYTPGSVLADGETTIKYQNTEYVVK